jgi:hypothetical protein
MQWTPGGFKLDENLVKHLYRLYNDSSFNEPIFGVLETPFF